MRPGTPAKSTPANPQRPEAGSTPQLNAPVDQGPSLDQGLDQGSGGGLKAPEAESRPAVSPSAQLARRPGSKALRAGKAPRAVSAAPMPRVGIYPPHEPFVPSPAPVPNPAASSSASANVPPPGRTPSFGSPGAGVAGHAAPHANVPAASALGASAIGHALTPKPARPDSVTKVASVRLPAMEKGLVTPKMPVAPIVPKIEWIPRPPEKLENCGDDKVFVACPRLKTRYDTPYTTEIP